MGQTVDGGSVNDEMGRRVGVSLRLLLIGSILGTLVGIAAGAYSAVKQYGSSDRVMTLVSFVILSVNTVVLAVFLANAGTSSTTSSVIGLFTTPANMRRDSRRGPGRASWIGCSI